MITINKSKDALIIIDVMRDFCPTGKVEWEEFEHIIPQINKLIPKFDLVFTTQDWHPKRHLQTKEGMIFTQPSHKLSRELPHCVVKTRGESCHHDLHDDKAYHLHKGEGPDTCYSAFKDTELESMLKKKSIERLFLCGLQHDDCIKETALDALKRGYEVIVVQEAATHVREDDERLFQELRQAGVHIVDYKDIIIKQLGNDNE